MPVAAPWVMETWRKGSGAGEPGADELAAGEDRAGKATDNLTTVRSGGGLGGVAQAGAIPMGVENCASAPGHAFGVTRLTAFASLSSRIPLNDALGALSAVPCVRHLVPIKNEHALRARGVGAIRIRPSPAALPIAAYSRSV